MEPQPEPSQPGGGAGAEGVGAEEGGRGAEDLFESFSVLWVEKPLPPKDCDFLPRECDASSGARPEQPAAEASASQGANS